MATSEKEKVKKIKNTDTIKPSKKKPVSQKSGSKKSVKSTKKDLSNSSKVQKSKTSKLENKVMESKFGTKHLKYNVLYPTGNEQEYFPMLKFEKYDGKILNELDLIYKIVDRDRKDPNRHVTTFYMISPPGLGKTVMTSWLARQLACPYQIINCVSTMTDLDLLGSQVLIGTETVWQDGPIPSIIRAANDNNIGILTVNELNALTQNAQIAFNPLLDRQEGVILTQNNNENVKMANNAHLIVLASMNPDVMGIHDLQDAVRDRASGIIYMDYPSEEDESRLVSKILGIGVGIVRPFADVISSLRKSKTIDMTLTRAPSTRGLIDWILYSQVIGVINAYKITIRNRYGTNEDERKQFDSEARSKNINSFSLKLPKSKMYKEKTSDKDIKITIKLDEEDDDDDLFDKDIHDLGDLFS